jgi:hypothetical protein
MMTRKEAKALFLEVWRYLAEHPEIESRIDLPPVIFNKIERLINWCPLCDIFVEGDCEGCPLNVGISCADGSFANYTYAMSASGRAAAAKEIVSLIEAWDAEA